MSQRLIVAACEVIYVVYVERWSSSLSSNTNDIYTLYAYDGIVHVRVPRGYADHPEDERIYTTPSLTHTNDSSFGDLLIIHGLSIPPTNTPPGKNVHITTITYTSEVIEQQ